jgi:hypothetical protein
MCEKLFGHVGEFREHAAKHVKEIVDNIHYPTKINSNKREMPKSEKFTEFEKSLLPLKDDEINDGYKVLMDEDDSALYQQ